MHRHTSGPSLLDDNRLRFLTAHLDGQVVTAAASFIGRVGAQRAGRAHAAAVTAWVEGRWHDAARTLDDLLVRWPADVLAPLMGHLLDFFVGDAQYLRNRVGRSQSSIDPDHPRTGFV